jgi:cytochrome c553
LALSVVPDSDVRAIAIYFSDIDHADAHKASVEGTVRRALDDSSLDISNEYDTDANLYASACLSCHYNTGTVPLLSRPELALNSALTLPEPTDFIQPILRGISNTEGAPGLVMPAYASSFTDAEVARLGAYLRRTRTSRPAWTDVENKVSAVRRQLAALH